MTMRVLGLALLCVVLAACGSDAPPNFAFGDVGFGADTGGDEGSGGEGSDAGADAGGVADAGADAQSDTDADAAAAACGNGVVEDGELCDGAAVGANACADFGFAGGTLTCNDSCTGFSFDGCESEDAPECGDGVREGTELCDGADIGGATCVDFGFDRGALACANDCTFDLEGCESDSTVDAVCGNGAQEPGELCDGADVGDSTCVDFGFDRGTLRCAGDCLGYDFEGCANDVTGPECGNNVQEPGELCDGVDVGDRTCLDFGYDRGALGCTDDCLGYDFGGCEDTGCTPDCAGRSCGPDPVCGVSCGTCSGDLSCNEAGQCVSTGGGGPRFITFNTNVRRITNGESVRFTAVVTDPDGIDDVIGGTLRDPVSSATYGSFTTSAAEGSYQIELSWDDIHFVRDIDLVLSTSRTFEAEFFDVAGERTTQTLDVELYCDNADLAGTCDGSCVDFTRTNDCGGCDIECLPSGVCTPGDYICECPDNFGVCGERCVDLTTTSNCGSCGNSCGGLGECVGGRCVCPVGYTECDGACLPIHAIGSCGASCRTCAANEWCDGFSCRAPVDGAARIAEPLAYVLEVYHEGQWRGVCDDGFDANDAEVACRQLGGTLLDFRTSQSGTSAAFWMDDMDCTGDELQLSLCSGSIYSSENCSAGEHTYVLCTADAPPEGCPSDEQAGAVINEVFYDAVGSDTGQEFIEILADPRADLGSMVVELVNGLSGAAYETWVLNPDASADGSGYFVIGGTSVTGVDQTESAAIQNGPDSIVLYDCNGERLDAVAYGTFGLSDVVNGEGSPYEGGPEGSSICRVPNGSDTDENALDFATCTPTPGVTNQAGGGDTELTFPILRSVSVPSTSPSYNRPDTGCVAGPGARDYQAIEITNTSSTDYDITIRADYDEDGYLIVYDGSLNTSSPLTNCIDADDDYLSTDNSRVTGIPWEAGQTLVIVISVYSNLSTTLNAEISITETI